MEYLILGFITAFAIVIWNFKWKRGRFGDLFQDIGATLFLVFIFGGTMGGMIIGMIAAAFISVFLLLRR